MARIAGTAAPLIPAQRSWLALRQAAACCRACPLWKRGTRTVFGEGPENASVFFVGEQPGDQEDKSGKPFVGPAGRLLDEALEEAGIPRADVYVTNVVKHFKWEPRGKRRIHKKPNQLEIAACLPWLEAELEYAKPRIVVCLGATAAQALLGRDFRVSSQRGQPVVSPRGFLAVATVHPSSVLRAPDEEARHRARADFVKDLRKVASLLKAPPAGRSRHPAARRSRLRGSVVPSTSHQLR